MGNLLRTLSDNGRIFRTLFLGFIFVSIAGCDEDSDSAMSVGDVETASDQGMSEPEMVRPDASIAETESDASFIEPDVFVPTGTGTSPGVGEIIFTEVHYDPHFGLSDGDAEWLEIHNLTNRSLSLEDCFLSDGSAESPLGEIVMAPSSYAIFGRSDDTNLNGGLVVDGVFEFALNNLSDRLVLQCGRQQIDVVRYDLDEGFPRTKGFSASLDPAKLNADDNDLADNWCFSRSVYLEDPIQWGTPGGPNTFCDAPVDVCRLHGPLVLPSADGSTRAEYRDAVDIFGRVRAAGLTERTSGNDAPGLVRGQLGFGPDGSNPQQDDGWTWIFARPNETYNANTASDPGFDEYVATLYIPVPDVYDYAYRFSVDGGRNWTICDGGMGSVDGYQTEASGQLSAQPPSAPCTPNPCVEPPVGLCDGAVAIRYETEGTCLADNIGLPECTYTEVRQNCVETEQYCALGQCFDREPAVPMNGDLVITEIMYNPEDPREEESEDVVRIQENRAEWFEVHNATSVPMRLDDCDARDFDPNRAMVTEPSPLGPVVVEPFGYVVFARDDDPVENGGLTVAGTFDFNLTNSGDTIILTCAGAEVDRVTYDPRAGFPDEPAMSISLDANGTNVDDNDLAAAWCLGTEAYLMSPQHLGTPGEPNPVCPKCVDFVCEQPAAICDGDTVVSYSGGACMVSGFEESCQFTETREVCLDEQVCREGLCVSPETSNPQTGDLVITEIMYNPGDGLADADGEYLEIVNVSGQPKWLGGCQLSDGSGVTLFGSLYAEIDSILLFARNDNPAINGGLSPTSIFDFSLNNNGDLIELRCGDVVIDSVQYGEGFPGAEQASLSLDLDAYDAESNDDSGRWCLSTSIYLDEPAHLGTPGQANDRCTD